MGKLRVETAILPAFLAPALINGDTSGLTEADEKLLAKILAQYAPGHIVSCEGESYFAVKSYPFRFAGDVANYTLHYYDESEG